MKTNYYNTLNKNYTKIPFFECPTPQDFFDSLNYEFHFTLDVAATKQNTKCKKFFTKEDNALEKDWGNNIVFCNPPYKDLEKWVKKAYNESCKLCDVVMLLPAWTGDYWFQFCLDKAEIRFIYGHLLFEHQKMPAPFPSILVIFRGKK